MRKELITNSDGSQYFSFVYYNVYDKKRHRLGREYIRSRFGKDITDPEEAEEVLAILSREVDSLSNEMKKRCRLSKEDYNMGHLLEIYTEAQKKRAPNSYRNNIHYLKYYVFPFFFENKDCERLDDWPLHYEAFTEWLESGAFLLQKPDQLISFNSKNHCIRSLNTFMRVMLRKNFIVHFTVCPQFPSYRLKEKSADDIVSLGEMESIYQRLITENHDEIALFYRLLFFTGMRFNEALGLSLGDVFAGRLIEKSFHRKLREHRMKYFGYIVIDSQPVRRRLVKDTTGHVPRKPLKGRKKIDEKSARVIPLIDQSLWIHLARYYNEALASHKRRLWGEDLKDYLLFNNITSTSSTELSRISSRLSIPYRSWHCLRHSRATYLIGHTGGDFLLVRMWLGHKSQAVLERYNHLYQSIVRDAKKGKILRPKPIKMS